MRIFVAIGAVIAIALGFWQLEAQRDGISITQTTVGKTPVTIYQPQTFGPVVVIAHGFAGSRQLMEAYALTLAQAGYTSVSFDFEGHGRNPTPMSGDVTSIDGTTRLLLEETARIIAFARNLTGTNGQIALLGHSMATDIIARAAVVEGIDVVVGISMFSQAVTATAPKQLLMISGQAEGHLRQAALDAQALVGPAMEGTTVKNGAIARRIVVAPGVEHVGVLYSQTGLKEAVAWLDQGFDRTSDTRIAATGGWIILMLGGVVALGWPLAHLLPSAPRPRPVPARAFWFAALLPAVLTPLFLAPFEVGFLPVLVADYLAVHAGLYGLLVLVLLRAAGVSLGGARALPLVLLIFWGIVLFGGLLDRYVASFAPVAARLPIIAAISFGAILAMVAESALTQAGGASFRRKTVARLSFLGSLAIATILDFEGLFFLLLILPLIGLFYASFGLMGGWVGRRSGAVIATGIGLGLCLGWAIGVSFPMFDPG